MVEEGGDGAGGGVAACEDNGRAHLHDLGLVHDVRAGGLGAVEPAEKVVVRVCRNVLAVEGGLSRLLAVDGEGDGGREGVGDVVGLQGEEERVLDEEAVEPGG